MNKAGNIFVGS